MNDDLASAQGVPDTAIPSEEEIRGALASFSARPATGSVNRTRRVLRERARTMEARQTKLRSLAIPLSVSGGLLVVIFFAVWSVLDQYEVTPTGLPDASQQMLVLLMWCLPLTVALLGIIWFKRSGTKQEHGSTQ